MGTIHRYMPPIMIVLGVLIALLCYFADLLGLGVSKGLGFRQLIGVLFGLVMVINGLTVWAVRPRQ